MPSRLTRLSALFPILPALALCLCGTTRVAAAASVSSSSGGAGAVVEQVIYISAGGILRETTDAHVRLYLQENASVCQGPVAVDADKLIVWIAEAGTGDLVTKRASVTVYRERTGPDTEAASDGPSPELVRLSSVAGIVIEGKVDLAGPQDFSTRFAVRAEAFRQHDSTKAARPTTEIQLSAEEVEGLGQREDGRLAVTLIGNAEVRYRELVLHADVIRLRARYEEEADRRATVESIYAQGAVDLWRGGDTILAEAIYLDLETEEGLALRARVRAYDASRDVSVQFYGDVVREMSRYSFRVEGRGYVSTSAFEKPHYRVEGRRVRFVVEPLERLPAGERPSADAAAAPEAYRQMVLTSRHNVLYLGSVPLFYWPYIRKDVAGGAFLLQRLDVGHRGTWGSFAKAKWDLYDLGIYNNDWSRFLLRTDVYSKRGTGVGGDFSYRLPQRFGFLRGYYINDTAREDDDGLLVPRSSRGEFTWRHREFLPDKFRLDLELGYLSDEQFLLTYDRDEFDDAKDRETRAFLKRSEDNTLFTAQLKERVNDFETVVERQSAGYHIIGEPLFDTPVLLTGHSEIARLQLLPDRNLNLPSNDPVTRWNTDAEFSLPFGVGPVRIDPFVWSSLGIFSRQAADEDGIGRGAGAYGARLAGNWYRTYDAVCDALAINGLRHVITPTIEYRNLLLVTRGPEHFVQHDDIDALDPAHRTTLGLRNRLQTYREIDGSRRRVDFFTLDTDYHLHHRQTGADRGRDDFAEVGVRWSLNRHIEIASEDNRYNTDSARIDALNGEVALSYWRPVRVLLGHQYYVDVTDPTEPTHSISSLRLIHRPDHSRWQTEIKTTYDFQSRRRAGTQRDPAALGTGLFLTRFLEGWEVRIGAEFNQGRANETRFSINIVPPGR